MQGDVPRRPLTASSTKSFHTSYTSETSCAHTPRTAFGYRTGVPVHPFRGPLPSLTPGGAGPATNGAGGPAGDPSSSAAPSARLRWGRGTVIGQGPGSKVFLGMNEQTGQLLAIKEASSSSPQLLQEVRRLSRMIAHPHLLAYVSCESDAPVSRIFTEYVPGGSLAALLAEQGACTETTASLFARSIASALACLHGQGVVHRNLKSTNVMLTVEGDIKVTDYGTAGLLKCPKCASSAFWMAPEVLAGGGSYPGDVWSLGCVVVEMMTGRHPFKHVTPAPEVWVEKLLGGGPGFAALQLLPPELLHPAAPRDVVDFVVDKCLQVRPELRADAHLLECHPFLVAPHHASDSEEGEGRLVKVVSHGSFSFYPEPDPAAAGDLCMFPLHHPFAPPEAWRPHRTGRQHRKPVPKAAGKPSPHPPPLPPPLPPPPPLPGPQDQDSVLSSPAVSCATVDQVGLGRTVNTQGSRVLPREQRRFAEMVASSCLSLLDVAGLEIEVSDTETVCTSYIHVPASPAAVCRSFSDHDGRSLSLATHIYTVERAAQVHNHIVSLMRRQVEAAADEQTHTVGERGKEDRCARGAEDAPSSPPRKLPDRAGSETVTCGKYILTRTNLLQVFCVTCLSLVLVALFVTVLIAKF